MFLHDQASKRERRPGARHMELGLLGVPLFDEWRLDSKARHPRAFELAHPERDLCSRSHDPHPVRLGRRAPPRSKNRYSASELAKSGDRRSSP